MLSLPIGFWGFGVHCIEDMDNNSLPGQHCHFLIFGFEINAQENVEEDPCMKIHSFEGDEELGYDCWHFEKMQTTIRVSGSTFVFLS